MDHSDDNDIQLSQLVQPPSSSSSSSTVTTSTRNHRYSSSSSSSSSSTIKNTILTTTIPLYSIVSIQYLQAILKHLELSIITAIKDHQLYPNTTSSSRFDRVRVYDDTTEDEYNNNNNNDEFSFESHESTVDRDRDNDSNGEHDFHNDTAENDDDDDDEEEEEEEQNGDSNIITDDHHHHQQQHHHPQPQPQPQQSTTTDSSIINIQTPTSLHMNNNNNNKPPKVPDIHPSVIRKHMDTLSTISFDIPTIIISDTTKTTTTTTKTTTTNNPPSLPVGGGVVADVVPNNIIEFPAVLLSKELQQQQQQNTSTLIEQCRTYLHLAISIQSEPIIIILIQSGRLAAAIFQPSNNNNNLHYINNNSLSSPTLHCTHHRTSVRYTVRKGQGKAQSAQDNQGRKAISVGSQLRRQGEIQLRHDIQQMLYDWYESIQSAAVILISIPRTMQKDLFNVQHPSSNSNKSIILQRHDPRIRRIPFDVGRPTYAATCFVYQTLFMTITIRENSRTKSTITDSDINNTSTASIITTNTTTKTIQSNTLSKVIKDDANKNDDDDKKDDEVEAIITPLSVLHIAAQNGDVTTLESLLINDDNNNNNNDDDENVPQQLSTLINQPAGIDHMTPLHYAVTSCISSNNPNNAASCIRLLLERGHANPCILDQKRRLPYSLATITNDKVRDAFRISRSLLGEEYCNWDHDAKVGTPLSLDELNDKLEKEAEKRRKKRLKQKEKKVREKAEEQATEERRLALEEERKKDEDAKRIRDGLQPKVATVPGGKACDFCQTVCVGKKRINMFKRLDYSYCTSECLQNHKRELMAAAAMARMLPTAS